MTCYLLDSGGGGGGGFPYGEVIGGIVGSLALVIALVALCKWEPIHKRLPFDPFLIFSTNDDGKLSPPSSSWSQHAVTRFLR